MNPGKIFWNVKVLKVVKFLNLKRLSRLGNWKLRKKYVRYIEGFGILYLRAKFAPAMRPTFPYFLNDHIADMFSLNWHHLTGKHL